MRRHRHVYDAMLEAEARLFSTARAWFRRALEVNAGIFCRGSMEWPLADKTCARERVILPALQSAGESGIAGSLDLATQQHDGEHPRAMRDGRGPGLFWGCRGNK